jgi:hypothetical protein
MSVFGWIKSIAHFGATGLRVARMNMLALPLPVEKREHDLSVRRVKMFATVLVFFALSGCGVPEGVQLWFEAESYSGDGVIYTCSNLVGGGYRIDFPKFDAFQPYTAAYSLSHVPKVYNREPVIYLRYDGDRALPRNALSDTFGITLKKSTGEVIQEYGRELHINGSESYILYVSYEPGHAPLHVKQLYFELDNCSSY